MENKDYGEIFCQAVDTIIGQRLEGVKYDSTILCTVVDDSWRDTGKYIVTNNGGITKFEAFSDNTNYRNNNNVYVQIPNGDWDQQKIIVGKKTDKAEEPYIYKKPFSSLVDITGNLITGNIERKSTGLIANQGILKPDDGKVSADQPPDETVINLWTYNAKVGNDEPEPLCAEEGAAWGGYTRLGIQAGFQSWLSTFYTSVNTGDDDADKVTNSIPRSVTQGKYGLRLIVTPKRESVVSVAEDEENFESAKYILELNTDDMNGNPYDFASFYTQQKLFDISSIGDIEKMQLQFYQTTGSFVDSEGYYISDVDFLGNSITPNLYVNDVYVSLGYDVDEFDTEMVQVYTLNPTTYSRTASPLTDNHKKIQLRWIHKMEDGSFKSITALDDIGDYEVRWYRYQLGAPSADEYSGVYWKYLSIQTAESNEIKDPDWELYNVNSDPGFLRYPGFFYSWAIPDTTLQQEQYKAIILYKGESYRSNIITFQNKDEVVSAPTVDAVQALSINCEDGTYGNYRIYNNGNSLLDFSQSSVKRQWKAYFKSALEEVDEENNPDCALIEAEQIEWIIPLTKTMIVLDGLPDENNSYIDDVFYTYDYDTANNQKTRVHIFKYGNSNKSYDISGSNTLTYRIKGYYSQIYSDNTIQCKVIKDKITYTATKEMTFGIAGTTGTDCTFILDFDNGITAVSPEDKAKGLAVSVTARLYDYENNEIDLKNYKDKNNNPVNITWTWKDTKTASKIQIGNDAKGITVPLVYNSNSSTLDNNYNILQATLTNWGDYDLIAYLPIPIRKEVSYDYIAGTTQIIYSSDGNLIDFFKNPYVLYQNTKAVNSATWECRNNVSKENGVENGTDSDGNTIYRLRYTPEMKKSKNGEYYLSPLSFYVDNSCENVCVVAKLNNEIIWSQPILIMTNRYPSAMLNDWDGNLNVGEIDKGTILAPRLVAGKKDKEDNTFSGVVLGDWEATNSDSSLTDGTGLFGYYKGEQSYAFREDGTAFIGKSSGARINFDGTSGKIYSSGYNNGDGTLINLSENLIEGKKDDGIIFKLSSSVPYFQITTPPSEKGKTDGKNLMYIGDSSYYLQSKNYESSSKYSGGTYLDLQNGELTTNSGTFNGDIYIRYAGAWENNYYDSEKTYSLVTLNSVLTQINSNIKSLSDQLTTIDDILEWQTTQIERINDAVKNSTIAVNDLKDYFDLGVGDKSQKTITMSTGAGGSVRVGNSVTLTGSYINIDGVVSFKEDAYLNCKDVSNLRVVGQNINTYIVSICEDEGYATYRDMKAYIDSLLSDE